jgi:hypothetical protein
MAIDKDKLNAFIGRFVGDLAEEPRQIGLVGTCSHLGTSRSAARTLRTSLQVWQMVGEFTAP